MSVVFAVLVWNKNQYHNDYAQYGYYGDKKISFEIVCRLLDAVSIAGIGIAVWSFGSNLLQIILILRNLVQCESA